MTAFAVILVGLSLASTSSAPGDRERELSEKRCATTFKRMQDFVRYWPPSGAVAPYMMYDPDKIGLRGYDLLGDLYFRGCAPAGLQADKQLAALWYQHAAVMHVPEAQWKLGRMFYEGDGVALDRKAGLSWITSAAIEGSTDAAAFLSSINAAVPRPVSPNSYETAARDAKARLKAGQAADRAAVVRDLSGLLVTAGAAYLGAAASPAAGMHSRPQPAQMPPPSAPTMTRPVYCSTYGTAYVSEHTNSVSATVSQFCR